MLKCVFEVLGALSADALMGRDDTVETVGRRNRLEHVACTPFYRDRQCRLISVRGGVGFIRIFTAANWFRSRAPGEAI